MRSSIFGLIMICGGLRVSAQFVDPSNAAVVGAIEKQSTLMSMQFGESIANMIELVKDTKAVVGTVQSAYNLQAQVRRDLNNLTNYSVNLGESVKNIFETVYNSIPADDYVDFYAIYMEKTAPLRGYNGELSKARLVDAFINADIDIDAKNQIRVSIENELFKSYYERQYYQAQADVLDAVVKELLMYVNINFYAAYGSRAADMLGSVGMSDEEKEDAVQTSRSEFEHKMQVISETMLLIQDLRRKSMELRRWRPERTEVELMVENARTYYNFQKGIMRFYEYRDPQYGSNSWIGLD